MSDTTEPSTLSPKTRDSHRNKIKRKFNRARLPTPPPDPNLYPEILDQSPESPSFSDKDTHFFEYINSIPKIPHVPLSPSGVTEDAFDHLERLYRLMEQMLNLRQQNAKLQRRIRDLEHLKNLQATNRLVENTPAPAFENISELDHDSEIAESLLDTMLGHKKDYKTKPWNRSRLRQSLMKKQRNPSLSINDKSFDFTEDRRFSTTSDRDKSSKVSKWTKVKAAFRWEKASPSVSGAKSQDSGIGGILPVNYEIARYLRVPSTTEDPGISPADSGAADGSTPGTLSSASSADDLHKQDTRADLRASDDDNHSTSVEEGLLSRQGSRGNSSSRSSWFKTKGSRSSLIDSQETRLSAPSDDVKIDISDGEDLVDDIENFNITNYCKRHKEIPEAVIERYREVIAEDETVNKQNIQSKGSKWNRVKKAFLTPSLHHASNFQSSPKYNSLVLSTYKDGRSLKNGDETRKLQDEIQKNYRQLQKKLSIEFQGKLQEWDKLKVQGTTSISKSDSGDDQKDHAFIKKMEEWQRIKAQPSKPSQSIQMLREENLAPEFKKKLEEWQKIKKYGIKDDCPSVTKSKKKIGEWPKWKSIGGHKEEHAFAESPPLSDDFIRKLEEWRKIKEIPKHNETKDKTPSPRLLRKQDTEPFPSKPTKDNNEKELHWFEKELNKIELEKQRLEQERNKFLQREEKLAKLRRTVMGDGNKKDVLIHTSSGFHKFEGISRKFTQKLCEWEKAQGIGPEASTFALLSPNLQPHITVDFYESAASSIRTVQNTNPRMVRSKSAESISTKNLVQNCPSHHPSSLSLNDVDELEKQMSLSRTSSMQEIDTSLDKLSHDEPEAVIVEVEDVEEETAGLLEEPLEEKHFPVYQREMALSICEKQPRIVPYIQSNYPSSFHPLLLLIDKTLKLVKIIEDDQEYEWSTGEIEVEGHQADSEQSPSPDILKRKDKHKLQNQRAEAVLEVLIRIQEMHSKYVCEILLEEDPIEHVQLSTMADTIQELFSDLFQMVDQLQSTLCGRQEENFNKTYFQFNHFPYSNITAITSELISKLCEVKKILSSFYSTIDKTSRAQQLNLQSNSDYLKDDIYQNDEDCVNIKRMRYKKRNVCSNTVVCDSEDSDTNDTKDKYPQKNAKEELDPLIIEKLVIPTKPNYVSPQPIGPHSEHSPVEILVRTTRKLFTPIIRTGASSSSTEQPEENTDANLMVTDDNVDSLIVTHLPPSKASPLPQRKTSKEISPGIRLMLAKYNQLISKQESTGMVKSAGSSGSASPVSWRSPVSERRVKAQRERYLEEIKRIGNNEVKKSASVNFLYLEKKIDDAPSTLRVTDSSVIHKGILRSTSASVIQTNNTKQDVTKHPPLKLVIPENINHVNQSTEARISKIKKAKEEFLNSPSTPNTYPSSAPPIFPDTSDCTVKYGTRSRYSQISMGSESSCDSSAYIGLVKSASAGMINIDEDTYKQIDTAFHREGYVSLPRSVTKQKEGLLSGKLILSNIAAKFRKVKMRKNKDQKKMNTVSALCRQSLVVNINPDNQDNEEKQSRSDSLTVPVERGASSSDDASPSSSRSGSWIRRSKIFKVL